MKVSLSGISCQPDLHLTLYFMPSRTTPSLCPHALSHSRAWAKCPEPCMPYPYCNIHHIAFVIKATIRTLRGTWWIKGPVDWQGLKDFVIFLQQRVADESSNMAPFYLYSIWWPFCLFSLTLFLCSSSTWTWLTMWAIPKSTHWQGMPHPNNQPLLFCLRSNPS